MAGPRASRDYPEAAFQDPPPLVHPETVDALRQAGLDVSTDAADRAEHGRDWWPVSLLDVIAGRVPSWPDAVVRVRDELQVASALRICAAHATPVTAQGGRSSVVGGAQPALGAVALDTGGLSRIGPVDVVSGLVEVDAGVFGPDLESVLETHGLTVGHFPQSFEISTVGGWVASRGAGQFSNRYGTAADLVRALRVVLTDGRIIDVGARAPRAALGPDLLSLFVGSEGTLGVIVRATLVARTRANFEQRRAFAVSSFGDGLDLCRRVVQRGAAPAVLRLYDEIEARRLFGHERAVLVVLDEGDEAMCRARMSVLEQEAEGLEALDVGVVARWLAHRNDVSALGELWGRGVVVDTIEVAAPWSALSTLHEEILAGLRGLEGTVMASVHQSHAYTDGACLYVTFAGVSEEPREYYRHAWDMAMGVAARSGALSHHHGVGRVRAPYLAATLGPSFTVLSAIKAALDPQGVLNPGVLGLASSS